MKVLCFELMEASGGRASASTLADLAASANELVVELTRRVHQVSPIACVPSDSPTRHQLALLARDAQWR